MFLSACVVSLSVRAVFARFNLSLQQGLTVLKRSYDTESDKDSVSSSHGDVHFVLHKGVTYAVKVQWIREPKSRDDRAYCELRVLLQLSKLAESGQCGGFVRLVEWFKGEFAVACASGRRDTLAVFFFFFFEFRPLRALAFVVARRRRTPFRLMQAATS